MMMAFRIIASAARWLLQSGRCFADHATRLFMHHGCRLHCAAMAYHARLRYGLLQANQRMVGHAASSGQPPSFKPFRLFDEKRAALFFKALAWPKNTPEPTTARDTGSAA